jgi:hypothetical protein
MKPSDLPVDIIVGEYTRANKDKLRATIGQFQGRPMFSIRHWWMCYLTKSPKGRGQPHWRPGRNGISLSFDEAEEFCKLVVALFPERVQLKEEAP